MSSALPSATRPLSSIRRTMAAAFLRATACATRPPSSPAPTIATSCMRCDIVIPMQSLNGKTAVVTGGSRGIGFAIAHALAAEGVKVAITGRSDSHLADARQKLERANPDGGETRRADVRKHADVEEAIGAVVERFGGLDILVNNAGVGVFTNVADMTPPQWADVLETNLTGVFNACHVALPHLRRRGGGFIVNISSLAGKNPFTEGAAYCASKSGL